MLEGVGRGWSEGGGEGKQGNSAGGRERRNGERTNNMQDISLLENGKVEREKYDVSSAV